MMLSLAWEDLFTDYHATIQSASPRGLLAPSPKDGDETKGETCRGTLETGCCEAVGGFCLPFPSTTPTG